MLKFLSKQFQIQKLLMKLFIHLHPSNFTQLMLYVKGFTSINLFGLS